MSLINPKDGWIRFDGTPVQGITPPQVRLRSGSLTPDRLAAVSDLYSKFTTAKRLSLAGGGFFTADRRLPDGTIVRMVAINDVDHVHIWAADTEPEEVEGITFWCIPWDSEWIDEAYTEVFTIPRWLEIGAGAEEVVAAEFLQDLSRNEKYEPPSDGLYPGNQTWFAPPPHPLAGIVVSWWGQMRRYSNSLLDQTIDAAGSWRRTMDPELVALNSDDIPAAPFAGRTGGIAGALAGQMFHAEGVRELPPEVTSTPVRTTTPRQNAVWINGTKVLLPDSVGGPVSSACLGHRGDEVVLRVVRAQEGSLSTIRILEMNLETGAWSFASNYNIEASSIGLPHPVYTISTSGTQTPAAFTPPYLAQPTIFHPFYWNADGSEAMGLLYYRNTATSVVGAKGVHVLVKLEVTGGGYALSKIDFSRAVDDRPSTITSTESDAYNGSATEVTSRTYTYVGIVAADYRGNTPMILRSHVEAVETITKTISKARTATVIDSVTWGTVPEGGPWSKSASSVESTEQRELSYVGSTTSKATLNGDAVAGTPEVRGYSSDYSYTYTTYREEEIYLNPDGYEDVRKYLVRDIIDQATGSTTHDAAATGVASLWGISAGDLRGGFLVHAQPLDGEFYAEQCHRDVDYSFTHNATRDFLAGGPEESTSSATFSYGMRLDVGRVLVASPSGGDEVTKLVHPLKVGELGSGTQAWVNGSPTTSTRVGPYGDGPLWTDFVLPETNTWPPIGNYSGSLQGGRINNYSRNYADFVYPTGAPGHHTNPDALITGFAPAAVAAAGGYSNTALVGSAMTPDLKTQYMGALFVAMAVPTALDVPTTYVIDKWFHEGNEFTPLYPPQPDPDNPGATVPFPHRGGHAILLDPIFTGPLP